MQPHGRTSRSRLDGRTLAEIGEFVRDCRLCRLCSTRTGVVFGEGSGTADLMIVAEAPGYHDDRIGEPISGASGALLDELLASIGFGRHEVYVTSVVKCRPPRNRSPFPDEIEQCEGYLFREVTLVQPRVICALGNVAIRLLTGKPHRLSTIHGTPLPVSILGRDVTVLPVYHPGATVDAPRLRDALARDFAQIPALLRGGPQSESEPARFDAAPAVQPNEERAQGDSAQEQLALELGS